jgi:hypothetical protein
MPKIKMPRWTTQTLTSAAFISEQGTRLPVPDARSMSFMTPAQIALLGSMSVPRPPQQFPAGSVVMTSPDGGTVRVITPTQLGVIFETSPEGGSVRVASSSVTQANPTGGTFISTNSDGTVNVGTAATHVLMTNSATGEQRVVSRVDAANAFEST